MDPLPLPPKLPSPGSPLISVLGDPDSRLGVRMEQSSTRSSGWPMDQTSDLAAPPGVHKVFIGVGALGEEAGAGRVKERELPGCAGGRRYPVAGGSGAEGTRHREPGPQTVWLCSLPWGPSSGRGRWGNVEKVCTSVNLSKACRQAGGAR